MKLVLGSLLGLLAFGASSANAQFSPFYNRPLTNPLQTPFFNPYNPYNPYSFYGNPAVRPFGAPGVGTQGPFGTGPALTTGVVAQSLGDPSMTGHPTRFFDYGGYFFNQGGTTGIGAGLPTTGAVPTAGAPVTAAIGTSPLRGRSSTTPKR